MFAHIPALALLFCIFHMYAALFFLFQSPTVFLSCHSQLEPILLPSDILNHHILHIFLRLTSHSSSTSRTSAQDTRIMKRHPSERYHRGLCGLLDLFYGWSYGCQLGNTLLISSFNSFGCSDDVSKYWRILIPSYCFFYFHMCEPLMFLSFSLFNINWKFISTSLTVHIDWHTDPSLMLFYTDISQYHFSWTSSCCSTSSSGLLMCLVPSSCFLIALQELQ